MEREEKNEIKNIEIDKSKLEESPWASRISPNSKKAVEATTKMLSTRYGLLASIPIICRTDKCPYKETCLAFMNGCAPEKEPCPVEISMIMNLYEMYTTSLEVDTSKIVVLGLIRDLIESDITINRCEAILARDGDILANTPSMMSPNGSIIYKKEPHIALGIKEKARLQKNQTLQLLNSTPKDKSKEAQGKILDPSSQASRILRKLMEEEKNNKTESTVIEIEGRINHDDNGDHQ